MGEVVKIAGAKSRGRPRLHEDDAARASAHRDKVQDELDTLHMLRTIFRNPSPHLIRHFAKAYAARKDDKALAGADFARALIEGLQAGGGSNCAEAAVNYFRYEYQRSALEQSDGATNCPHNAFSQSLHNLLSRNS